VCATSVLPSFGTKNPLALVPATVACDSMVGICAVKAAPQHRWAGITFEPLKMDWRCWSY